MQFISIVYTKQYCNVYRSRSLRIITVLIFFLFTLLLLLFPPKPQHCLIFIDRYQSAYGQIKSLAFIRSDFYLNSIKNRELATARWQKWPKTVRVLCSILLNPRLLLLLLFHTVESSIVHWHWLLEIKNLSYYDCSIGPLLIAHVPFEGFTSTPKFPGPTAL